MMDSVWVECMTKEGQVLNILKMDASTTSNSFLGWWKKGETRTFSVTDRGPRTVELLKY